MSAIKEYALGVCYAHPKEMRDLCDLLLCSEHAEQAVALELIERNNGDTYTSQEVFVVMFAISEILDNVSDEDARIMLLMIPAIIDSRELMEEELAYWRGRCTA